jgi:hypothetical protein
MIYHGQRSLEQMLTHYHQELPIAVLLESRQIPAFLAVPLAAQPNTAQILLR